VQAPVPRAGKRRLWRQAGALKEEHQRNGAGAGVAGQRHAKAVGWQRRGEGHHAEDAGDVGVDVQPGEQRFHGHDYPNALAYCEARLRSLLLS